MNEIPHPGFDKPEEYETFTTTNDLDKVAEISFDEANALGQDYINFLAKGLAENYPRPIGPHWFCEYAKKRFIAGAKWQAEKDKDTIELAEDHAYLAGAVNEREQMMKEAVEKTVGQEETIIAGHPVWGKMIALTEVDLKGFEYGDKVKLIIIKDDGKSD